MNKETLIIDGVRYYADRPQSCRGCFFWKNRKVGCSGSISYTFKINPKEVFSSD